MFLDLMSKLWSIVWFIPSIIFDFLLGVIYFFGKVIFPDYNYRKVKALIPTVNKINLLREEFTKLSNEDLKNKTNVFKERLVKGETLDDILVEAFATVKETSRRILGLEHYDEQIMAGITLHRGCMTEMKTGEGKTLAATLAVYLNALLGKGVHVATVNDYLAKRDADEMGRIYSFLGLSCGALLENMDSHERKAVYALDIVYAMGSTLGFDYLYDNMEIDKNRIRQRDLDFVIVDEADKLIDDGRTPLIISSQSEDSLEYYSYLMDIINQLDSDDYEIERAERSVSFSEKGLKKINELLQKDGIVEVGETLYSSSQLNFVHGLNQCLHANVLLTKNVDYIVDKRGRVLLVDEHTGRVLDGRRLSNGLHQAIEAKERVRINVEGKTSASISYQKFFGLYKKFAGMSGTCLSEAEEFHEIYGVDTISIPTHKPIIRIDEDDEIYIDFEDKFNAIVKEVKIANEKFQPVLVITGSVEYSEIFSSKFKQLGWQFNVLNAKRHKEEADIIAQAGMPGAITIATNMAGRGTDIQLGGNLDMYVRNMRENGLSEAEIEAKIPSIRSQIKNAKKIVLEAGGLFVIGTERNESRRVDDQARGRAGRQGDPGKSKFMISLEDPLMKNFGNSNLLRRVMTKGEPIHDPLITRQVAKAQRAVEARSFDQRKYLLKYDSVLDEQRLMIYNFRKKYLFDDDLYYQFEKFVTEKIKILKENFNNPLIVSQFKDIFRIEFNDPNEAEKLAFKKLKLVPVNHFKNILLKTLDDLWADHLSNLSYIQQITSLRAHGQKDPLTEYKIEASKLFENLLQNFVNKSLSKVYEYIESDNFSPTFNNLEEMLQNFMSSNVSDEDYEKIFDKEQIQQFNQEIKNLKLDENSNVQANHDNIESSDVNVDSYNNNQLDNELDQVNQGQNDSFNFEIQQNKDEDFSENDINVYVKEESMIDLDKIRQENKLTNHKKTVESTKKKVISKSSNRSKINRPSNLNDKNSNKKRDSKNFYKEENKRTSHMQKELKNKNFNESHSKKITQVIKKEKEKIGGSTEISTGKILNKRENLTKLSKFNDSKNTSKFNLDNDKQSNLKKKDVLASLKTKKDDTKKNIKNDVTDKKNKPLHYKTKLKDENKDNK